MSEQQQDETGRGPAEEKSERNAGQRPDESQPVPLFLRGRSDGRKGDAQDEKDEAAE
jgi:hypothetical protein